MALSSPFSALVLSIFAFLLGTLAAEIDVCTLREGGSKERVVCISLYVGGGALRGSQN